MKHLPHFAAVILLAGFTGHAAAADRSIVELQRDMALLQDQVKTLDEKIAALQTLLQQVAQQSAESAAKADARMEKFQESVGQSIKSEMSQLSGPLAGAVSKLDSMGGEVSSLRDASGEVTRQLTSMRSRMDEMTTVMKAIQSPAAAPPGEGQPQPSKLFADATADMSGKQDMALQEFADFLRMFPNDPMASQAQFNIGQIHFGEALFEPAAEDFDIILTQYSKSQQVPDAMYMKGLSLMKAGRRTEATEAFKLLVTSLPQSTQAAQAREQLRTLSSAGAARGAR